MWAADLVLSLSLPAVALLGWPVVAAFRRRFELDGATCVAASLALGLMYVEAGAIVLGFTGLLGAPWLVGWLGLGAAASAGWGVRSKAFSVSRPTMGLAWAVTGLTFLPYLLAATVPPWYRDEMVYHLALPRAFAVAGAFVPTDDNMYASMPLGWESVLAALHALGPAPDRFPPFNPRLAGAWTTLAAALGAVGLARALGVSASVAAWAAPLFLAVPTVLEFGPSAYVEPYLVLLATLALIAALRAREGRAFVLASGLFCGAAASVKYPGLAIALFCAVVAALGAARSGGRLAVYREVGLFCAAAAPLGAPFLLRNLVERGNPFFPFLWPFFRGSGWDDWRAWGYSEFLSRYGAGREPLDYLLLPFRLFGWRDLSSGFEGSLGPVLGAGAIACAIAIARSRGTSRVAGAFAGCWFLFWAATTQQTRFFLVATPALFALLLLAVEQLRRRSLTLGVLLALSWAWSAPLAAALWTRQGTTDWLLSRVSRAQLLERLLPGTYAVDTELESLVPPDGKVWLVWTRNFTYYLRRASRQDSVFEGYRLEALLDDPRGGDDGLLASLRRDHITHLLVNEALFLREDNAELRPGRTRQLRERFESLVQSGALQPVRSWGPQVLYAVRP